MPPPPSHSTRALQTGETILIACAGGAALGLLGVPAGYISGSLVAVALAGLLGRKTYVPMTLVRLVLFSLGVVLGSAVTPETIRGVATWPISIVMMAVALVGIFAGTSTYLRVVHGWDALSALFAASPGALSQVVALSVGANVNLPAVIIVQTMRVVFLAVGIPIGLALVGHHASTDVLFSSGVIHTPGEMVVLLIACAATAGVFTWVRFPGGILFGSMTASAVLHGSGLIAGRLPAALTMAAMIGVGVMTGSRFQGTTFRMLGRYFLAAVGAFTVAMTVTAICALILVALFPFRISDVVLAFSPGAQDAVMILVLSLAGDPVYVGAHHVARFVMVSAALPVIMKMFGGTPPPAPPTQAAPDD